ncbi:MAG: SRPBCC family protein [Deltaproteobacteria bacterium]|nr:MAG: SRPBCC family protein [Deltaproteobacteria bacterium]UCF46761.1 MAG: SRPBCC family protein [Myxococcales bacterium]
MTKMNKLDPVTLDFFDTAPLRVRCTMVAKCTPEVLFETLRGDTVWTEWAGVIQGVEWTSEKPYAKNATRDVSLVGGMLVKEVFFHWEENERVAFYVTDSTIPNLSKFAEDYIVEGVGPNETRLIWTVAIENMGFMRYLNPVTGPVLKLVFRGWFKKYKKILEARAAQPAPQPTAAVQPRA